MVTNTQKADACLSSSFITSPIEIIWNYDKIGLTVRSSRYMVFDKKSIPIVACKKNNVL